MQQRWPRNRMPFKKYPLRRRATELESAETDLASLNWRSTRVVTSSSRENNEIPTAPGMDAARTTGAALRSRPGAYPVHPR